MALNGVVIDESELELHGVEVNLKGEGIKQKTFSDKEGKFTFEISVDKYELVFRHPGYYETALKGLDIWKQPLDGLKILLPKLARKCDPGIISGPVIQESGTAIEGVEVHLTREGGIYQTTSTDNVASVSSQESEAGIRKLGDNVVEELSILNLGLKKASSGKIAGDETKMTESEAEILELARRLWLILDEQLVSYLEQFDRLPVEEINKALRELFRIAPTVEEGGWSARIELCSVNVPDLYLATYTNWFWLGNHVSTLRVLQKSGGHWQVVGRMEETALARTLEPRYRETLKRLVKEKESLLDGPNIWMDRALGVTGKSIQMNGVSISTRSIQRFQSGELRFATIHSTLGVGQITVETLIEWEWKPGKGLEAIAWVWGDEWTYDEKIKSDVAKWHSLDKSKNGKPVRLQDYRQ